METRLAGQIFGSAFLGIAVTLGVSAQPRTSQAPAAAPGLAAPIRLRAATFTPARGERPAIAEAMTIRDEAPGRRAYYIVQLDGPIDDAKKAALVAQGADILDYIPEFALKIRVTPAEARRVAQLAGVTWVGLFHPAYKISPDVVRDARMRPYVVRIERGAEVSPAEAAITATGAQVVSRDNEILIVTATGAQIEAVARVLDVAVVEAFAIRQKHNEHGGSIIGADIAHGAGYDGSTQTIAISDTGLGGGTATSAHADLQAGRIAGIYNWPGVPSFCFETIVSDGPVDVDTGHGTHVATSALGGGNASGVGGGTAPASRLVFQAIEDFAVPSFFCQFLLGLGPGYYLTGIPANISALYQQGYDAGARVHSNSWGSAANGAYTTDSVNTDTFLWTHRDLAVTISSGNSGIDANGDGVVDAGSLMSPGTAKNVITVGASEGDRGANYDCDAAVGDGACAARGGQNDVFTYGAAFAVSFPSNPLKDDPSAGNAEQMAAFSSRGPTSDGRIKPDVVAPGTWILSGYSDRFQQYYDPAPNPQNGGYQYDGWGDPLNDKYKYMGGTSMSAPLVAGAAAVVRDYYEKTHAQAASGALVKATLVNSAVDLLDENNDGVDDNAFAIPNIHEGWGRVDVAAAVDGTRTFEDEAAPLSTGSTATYGIAVDDSARPLKVTLAWTDAPSTTAAAKHLVNDLDLELVAPDGTTYVGNMFLDGWSVAGGAPDRTNNLENIYVAAPAAGEWTVIVRAFNVPNGPQPFAMVIGRGATPVQQIPRVSVVASDPDATEAGLTPGTFTLTRSGSTSAELTVAYAISGTATAGADYEMLGGSITFAPGEVDAFVTVTPADDSDVESDETIVLTVEPGASYGVRAPSTATIVLVSDDQPGDLVISAISAPSTAGAGGAIVLTDTTRNQGSWPAAASETGFFLSTNLSWDSGDVFLGSRPVAALQPGATSAQPTTLPVPTNVLGPHYIIARADWNGVVIETSESNNTRTSALVRIGPDLVVSTLTIPASAAAGATITLADTTRNDGPQDAAASTTAFYLSSNSTWDAGDIRLGSRGLPPLATGVAHSSSTDVMVPLAVATGSYYVIARADDEGSVPEGNESNNTRSATPLKIGADLIVSAVSGPSSAAAGGTMLVTDSTRNQGAADAPASTTAFYLSSNSTLDAADRRLGSHAVAALGAGVTATASITLTVPGTVLPAAYFLIAQADDDRAVAETIESNNRRVATTKIKVGADLTVTGVAAPSIGGAGASLTVVDTIENEGGAPSTPTEAVLYLSANTTLDTGDVELGRRPVGAIASRAADSASVVVTLPADTAVGSYYIIETVDAADLIDEALETNNTYRSGLVRVGPDLTMSALSLPSTVNAGSTVTVSDTTRNTGGGQAGPSTTAFYLSSNTTLDAADIRVGSRAVPTLTAGLSAAGTSAVIIPATLAPGTYYLIAQADDGAAVGETMETNNTRRVTIKVSAPAPAAAPLAAP
jgi:subtilase family serine protease/subtilisin family serine protease